MPKTIRKPARPAQPKPWEAPGYTFSLQPVWPPGFVPSEHDSRAQAYKEAAQRGRQTALANGHTGTIRGLMPKHLAGTLPEFGKQMVAAAKARKVEAAS